MKYSKKELLAMMPPREEVDPMFQDAMTRSAIAGRNGLRGEIAAALADKLQKPVVLSVKEIWDILDNFSQPQSSIFNENPYNGDLAEAIHAAMKKETT